MARVAPKTKTPHNGGGVGYCAALNMKVSSSVGQFRWQSVDYVYEVGSGII